MNKVTEMIISYVWGLDLTDSLTKDQKQCLVHILRQAGQQGLPEGFQVSVTALIWQFELNKERKEIEALINKLVGHGFLVMIRKPTDANPELRMRLGTALHGKALVKTAPRVKSDVAGYHPSLSEIAEYFTELTSVNGDPARDFAKEFHTYYESAKWKKSNGKPLLYWKQAMAGTWKDTITKFASHGKGKYERKEDTIIER